MAQHWPQANPSYVCQHANALLVTLQSEPHYAQLDQIHVTLNISRMPEPLARDANVTVFNGGWQFPFVTNESPSGK